MDLRQVRKVSLSRLSGSYGYGRGNNKTYWWFDWTGTERNNDPGIICRFLSDRTGYRRLSGSNGRYGTDSATAIPQAIRKQYKLAGGFLAKAGTVPSVSNCYAAVTWLTAEGESQTSPTVRYSTIPLKNGTADPTRNTWFLSEGTDYDGATEQDQSAGEKDKL